LDLFSSALAARETEPALTPEPSAPTRRRRLRLHELPKELHHPTKVGYISTDGKAGITAVKALWATWGLGEQRRVAQDADVHEARARVNVVVMRHLKVYRFTKTQWGAITRDGSLPEEPGRWLFAGSKACSCCGVRTYCRVVGPWRAPRFACSQGCLSKLEARHGRR